LGAALRQGRGWAEEEEGKGREGEVEGREREGPKLLLNQGPSEPCYATEKKLMQKEMVRGILTVH